MRRISAVKFWIRMVPPKVPICSQGTITNGFSGSRSSTGGNPLPCSIGDSWKLAILAPAACS